MMSWTSLILLFWTLAIFVHLSYALPQGGSCICNGRISDKGNGECQTTHQGSEYCYVTSGECTDQQESSQSGWFWSFEACKKGEGTSSSRCVTTGGDDTGSSCVFPFIFENQVYNGCTLAGADDGIPWCSTKVDSQGVHVSGEGKWGHCGQGCPQDEGSHIGLSTPQNKCTCDDHTEIDNEGRETGNCLSQYRGSSWCYIDSSSKCGDKKPSSKYPSLFWSQIACQTNPDSVTTEERIRKNEERIRRKGNTAITNRSGSSSCAEFVTSPGFPGKYPTNYGPQETQIRVAEGNSIEIMFQHLDVESCYWCSSRKCRWDWLEFKDGDGKLVGERLCGDDLPSKFIIPTSTASVSFRSDFSVQTTGYKICYESKSPDVKMECNFDDNELLSRGRSPHNVSSDYIWSNGRIPFVFTQTVGTKDKELFLRVIKKIESKTCFKFTEHNSPPTSEKYLEIIVDDVHDNSCIKGRFKAWVTNKYLYSDNKMRLRSKNKLADKAMCQNNQFMKKLFEGLILHEFFHVLGVGHTQKRKDRNKYIEVLPKNILDYSQYDICDGCTIYPQIPYECSSIMHYGSDTSRKPGAGPTMESRRSSCKISPGGSTVATDNDWKLLKIIADQVCGFGSPQPGGSSDSSVDSVLWIPFKKWRFTQETSSLTLSLSDLSRETSDCEIPDPGVDAWSRQSARFSQFQMIQGKLYVCNHLVCKSYNEKAKTWDIIGGMKFQTKRESAASTVIGDKWIITGGKGDVVKDVPTTEEWTPGQPNWKVSTNNKHIATLPVSGHCLVNLQDGRLMQIGGYRFTQNRADGDWVNRCFIDGQEVAAMKRKRVLAACLVFQGKVYVAAGYVNGNVGERNGEYKSVEIYDPQRDQWTDGPRIPLTEYDFKTQLVEIENHLHYIGGEVSGKIWKLGNNRWEQVGNVKKGKKFAAVVIKKHCK